MISTRRAVLLIAAALSLTSCKSCKKEKEKPVPVDVPPPPRVTTAIEIGTDIGSGRVLDVGAVEVSTATKWTRVVPLDKETAVLGGIVEGEACVITTETSGRSFSAACTKFDMPLATWSVGEEGVAVLTLARRQIPKTAPKQGTLPPVDTLSFLFAPPGQKLSAPAALLAPDPKAATPTVPRGTGMATVLGPSLASVVVELRPKVFAVAFSAGAGEAIPPPIDLPAGEEPAAAPYGRRPQLLTVKSNKLFVRPWPKPGEKLADPKPVERLGVTKALLDELSAGPECEVGSWSFKRVGQPPNKTFVLGVSPEKTTSFELPETSVATTKIACSADRVIVEAINPTDKLPSLVTCTLDGKCVPPDNRPFLKPWAEQHERRIDFTPTTRGVAAAQLLRSKVKWGLFASESADGGKLYGLERRFGEGQGNPEDGYDMGALFTMGDRTMLLMSAKVKGSPRRSWYVLASDDGGSTWVPP